MFDVLITKAVVFTINCVGLWLMYIVRHHNKNTKTTKMFIAMTCLMFVWVDFAFMARLPSHIEYALLWIKIAWSITPLLFVVIYFFIIEFLKIKNNQSIYILTTTSGVLFIPITLFTDLIISNIEIEYGILAIIYGKFVYLFFGTVIVFTILSFRQLFKKYYAYKSTKDKLKIEYLILGMVIFFLANAIFNIALPVFFHIVELYEFGDYSTIFLLSLIAYSIVKQELFGIKTILTTFFVATTTILLSVDVLIFTESILMQIVKSLILIIFTWLGYGLIKSVKKEIKRREETEILAKQLTEKSQDVSALLAVSQISATSIHAEETTQKMMDFIPTLFGELGYLGGMLALDNKNSKKTTIYVITQNKNTNEAGKLINQSIDGTECTTNLLSKSIYKKNIFTSNNLGDFFCKKELIQLSMKLQKKIKVGSVASVPIIHLGQTKGAILFLLKKKALQINQRDHKIMSNFANQLGAVLTNSELFEKISNDAKKLKKMNTDLNELLESKSTFLSIASHQLRTPVSIAKGMLSMIVDGNVPADKKESFIKRSLVSVERLSGIIHDLLSANAVERKNYKLNKEDVNIEDIIQKAIQERKDTVKEKKIKMNFTKSKKEVPKLRLDPNKMREVISNLLDNSIQYTPTGSIDITAQVKQGKFYLKIKDTGIGIKKEDMKKLFKKVSRLSNAISVRPDGTGLGLYLVKKIVKAHKGGISVKSSGINKGSTFTIYLPLPKTKKNQV